jgi:hypothetical protein
MNFNCPINTSSLLDNADGGNSGALNTDKMPKSDNTTTNATANAIKLMFGFAIIYSPKLCVFLKEEN